MVLLTVLNLFKLPVFSYKHNIVFIESFLFFYVSYSLSVPFSIVLFCYGFASGSDNLLCFPTRRSESRVYSKKRV